MIDDWERLQASIQFACSLLSLLFGLAYMLLFAVSPSLWRYPQSLAFFIYSARIPRHLPLQPLARAGLRARRRRVRPRRGCRWLRRRANT